MSYFKNRTKDYDYYGYFIKNAQFAFEAAKYLDESLARFDKETFGKRVAAMHKIENNADTEKHDMMQQLGHEFITPIEREDIVALSQQLDNVVDAIDDVMLRVDMLGVSQIRPETLNFTKLIIKCTGELLNTVTEFRSFKSSKKIRSSIVAVNTYESEGDGLHSKYIRDLYSSDADARTLLIWTNIFDDLELCLDACEDAIDIIESVIMKNS